MKKRHVALSLLLSLALLLSILPVFSTPVKAESETKQIVILHTNDTHGRVVGDSVPGKDGLPKDEGIIGFARYKTIIDKIKEANEGRVLVLDAGDTTHGTNFATLSKGQSVIRVMNEVGVQAMAVGNHEYNYGQEELAAMVKEADFPVLAANIVRDSDGSKPFESHTIFEVEGIRIGVFGLSTPETKVKSSPPNTEGLTFDDVVKVAQEEVDALKAEKVDMIVGLCHLGIDMESTDTSKRVIENVKGIDLLIDGHSHTLLPEGEMVGDTLLVQTGAMFANVGVVTLTFEDKKLVDKKSRMISFLEAMQYEPNPEVQAYIDAIEEENERVTAVEVGKCTVDLDGEREHVRTGETNLGDLVVDAILWGTGADCAISNGGNVRASIPAGPITMGDLLTVLPFGNMVTVIEVTGKDIKDALIFGADAYPGTAGKFPHVSNLSYEIHKEGDKYVVKNILLDGAELEDDRVYKLATNDFMAVGGDGYTMFEGKKQVMLQGLMVDLVVDYIKHLMGDTGEFEYHAEGRIKVVE